MTIVHIIFSFTNGGAENLLIDIINQQILEQDVLLIIINEGVDSQLISKLSPNVRTFQLKRRKGQFSPFVFLKLNFLLFQFSPHVIHCHNYSIINALFPLFHCKSFLTVHDTRIEFRCLIKYKGVFAISYSVQKYLCENSFYNSQIVFNGINFDNIKISAKTEFDSRQWFKIVQVSRLEAEKKGQDLLIRALAYLKQCGINNISIDFIGSGSSLIFLQKLVESLGLKKEVHFLGEKDREYINNNLCNYDLMVQPSRYEGFGLTVVEGLSANVPVLVSNIEGPAEIIKYGKYGTIFKSGNYIDLASKIQSIKENYSESLQKSLEGRIYALDNFNIKRTARSYIFQYNRFIS